MQTNLLKDANNLFKKGNFEAALVLYREAKDEYPELEDIIGVNIKLAEGRVKYEFQHNKYFSLDNEEKIFDDAEEQLSNKIFIGIAAIPDRCEALKRTINSLLPQVENIGVYLNGWKKIPDFLNNKKIVIAGFEEEDLGDIGKFYWVDSHDGIYFSCDDDLIYPANYVSRTLAKLKEENYRVAVGWHGSLLHEPFEKYYDKNSRRVFSFAAYRPWDTPVHILGTGCSAFHTKILKIKKSDFLYPNMADIFFSIKGQEQKIPFVVIAHDKGEIIEYEGSKENSIYAHSHAQVESKKNTYDLQNKFVINNQPWVLNNFKPLSLLIIGRFNTYSKGGIFKSCHLIQKYLSDMGHVVDVFDTQDESFDLIKENYDLCWIYPGDPERPDFLTVEDKILKLKQRNIPVIVNLSYLYDSERSSWIKDKLLELNSERSTPVLGAVFTESAANDPLLREVRDYICVVPKTILPTPYDGTVTFGEREGICLGDATKLGNSKIIGGSVNPWIDAIHNRLPHVNLYAYKQYQGNNPHPKIKYVPHMKEDFGNWLAHRRLFICANVHLTFEMVACEAQSYGTPVIYRHMPHSLSEYISATGLATRTPEEMAEMVAWLYNDQISWDKFSKSSIKNSESKHINCLDASLEGYLRLAIFRINQLKNVQ